MLKGKEELRALGHVDEHFLLVFRPLHRVLTTNLRVPTHPGALLLEYYNVTRPS